MTAFISTKRASDLHRGEHAVIEGLEFTPFSLKLLEMGCLPGKEISLLRSAPMGGPLYLQIGSQFIALRPEEAADIQVTIQA